uniref:Telomere repeat binding bouquet formation protein 2 n=1 Tax=Dromaius novaehollandiae TaxID=8790 RepID=A0A8C4KMM7_DRONO
MVQGCRGGVCVSPAPTFSLTLVFAAEAEGGALARCGDADYLFSSDAAHPDTRRIHESLDYLDGRATVFHACYLSAWANTSSDMKQSVVLGHFILPPACLQEEIRRKIGSFIWEQMDDSHLHFLFAGYVSARDMKKYVGELCDFIPGTSGYTAYWIQNEINIYSDVKNKLKRK